MLAHPWTWLVTASMLSVAAGQSDSILDIIDTQEVERLIAERRANLSSGRDPGLRYNVLGDDEPDEYPDLPQPQSSPARKNNSDEQQLQELLSRHGEKFLRSSKSALLVTKGEYLRKDWCKTEPLVQVVKEEGCAPVSIVNRFCYGQCNSFYIPKSPPRKSKATKSEYEDSAFRSCAFCKPKKSSWITVTLRCHKKKRPVLRRKKVLRIKQCKCIAEVLN